MKDTNYFFNSVENNYEKILDSFSNTEVHSVKTSSIPLAEFWMPKNAQFSSKILEKLGLLKSYDAGQKIFEYPVYSEYKGNKIGKPSMTDLMIKFENTNVAIEGKFTEDLYETITKWLKSKSQSSQKAKVLEGWYSYIKNFCDFDENKKDNINDNVVYQFLHRTASACYKAKNPILIYQLFYDAFDEESRNHQLEVATKLKEFAYEYLKFKDTLRFYVVFTPILNVNEVEEMYEGQKSSIFVRMKKEDIYQFGDSKVFDCSKDNIDSSSLPNFKKCKYSDDEFIKEYEKLYEETWHQKDTRDVYQERIKKVKTVEPDAFDKEKSQKRYNPKFKGESYTKEELESKTGENKNEEWKFLSNSGYTKYAVSSEGRVAFKPGNDKYEIISQYDINGNGYLKLDYERKYNLDHSIEVYKLIAMGFLGKTIGDGYDVHHKINDGYNCRPSNLILLTRAQHNAVHSGDPISDENLKNFLKD